MLDARKVKRQFQNDETAFLLEKIESIFLKVNTKM
jgi:hypothetical protein